MGGGLHSVGFTKGRVFSIYMAAGGEEENEMIKMWPLCGLDFKALHI